MKKTTIFMQAMIILLLLTNNFCNNANESGQISEGEIEYNVRYQENGKNNLLIALLPSQVTTYFKENSSCTLIEGDLGLFKLAYILNEKEQKGYSLLQIIDKKYVYESTYGEPTYGYDKMDGLKIHYTDKSKKIANYTCSHAMVLYNNSNDTIHLYYTDDINLVHPNLNNPFKEIEGVLLEFSVVMAGIGMEFTAEKIREVKVKEERFSIPKGYIQISEEQMNEEINKYYYSTDK